MLWFPSCPISHRMTAPESRKAPSPLRPRPCGSSFLALLCLQSPRMLSYPPPKASLDPPCKGSGGQVASEHHPLSGRKQVGHDLHVFRHSATSGRVIKQDHPGGATLKPPSTQPPTHPAPAPHWWCHRLGPTTDKTCFSRGPKHGPDHSTRQCCTAAGSDKTSATW